jgi:HEAT repeat protein
MRANGPRLSSSTTGNQKSIVRILLTLGLTVGGISLPGWGLGVRAQSPGPELFAREPKTALELWDAVDYLIRTGQAKKAAPYLDRFVKSKPTDIILMAIRNQYGSGSVLRLSDDPATRAFAKPLTEAMIEATRKYRARPERIAQFIIALRKTPAERDYAIRHLREAGPYAVPFLIDALARPDLLPADRKLIVQGMGELDRSAIPALAAVLDSPDASLASDAATALGTIGNRSAIPFLTYAAARAGAPPVVRHAAQTAIERLTAQAFSAQLQSPVQVLTDAAWRYHRHQIEFPEDTAVIWTWDKVRNVPVPQEVSFSQAEAVIGSQLAQQAVQLVPSDLQAQAVQLSMKLEAAVNKVGFTSFPAKDQAMFVAAKAAGSGVLTEVLKLAIADGKSDLAAAAVMALGDLTDMSALTSNTRPHPVVDALITPNRRVQFAAAKVITEMAPTKPFPGSSRVVPTLARFIRNQPIPRAVVIDGNPNRGSQLAGLLISLGYDSEVELSGNLGFRAAVASADVELILVSFDLFRPGWGLHDTLANLTTDARTAAIPVFVYGPLSVQYNRPNLEHDYPSVKFLVQPGDADTLQKQLKGLPITLTEVERASYAVGAATLLARISSEQKGPFAADLAAVEPALSTALGKFEIAPTVAAVLGRIPNPDAQRSLAAVILDPSRSTDLRRTAASQLVHSIQRFGRLVTAYQEARFARMVDEESDPDARTAIESVIQALHRAPRAGLSRPSARLALPAPARVIQPAVTVPSRPTADQ